MTPVLRQARSTDAGAVGGLLKAAVVAHDWQPDLHSGAEAVAFAGTMIDRGWVTVAADDDAKVIGFLARNGIEVNSLFVAAHAQRRGVGKRLLDHAKAHSTTLELWTFVANTGAQRFYLREGFAEIARTDGADNEERLPDIRYRWMATG